MTARRAREVKKLDAAILSRYGRRGVSRSLLRWWRKGIRLRPKRISAPWIVDEPCNWKDGPDTPLQSLAQKRLSAVYAVTHSKASAEYLASSRRMCAQYAESERAFYIPK